MNGGGGTGDQAPAARTGSLPSPGRCRVAGCAARRLYDGACSWHLWLAEHTSDYLGGPHDPDRVAGCPLCTAGLPAVPLGVEPGDDMDPAFARLARLAGGYTGARLRLRDLSTPGRLEGAGLGSAGDRLPDDDVVAHVLALLDRVESAAYADAVRSCPTRCDDDCESDCHEGHEVVAKRCHAAGSCGPTLALLDPPVLELSENGTLTLSWHMPADPDETTAVPPLSVELDDPVPPGLLVVGAGNVCALTEALAGYAAGHRERLLAAGR